MRMKLNKSSQLAFVAAASLLAATLVTACSQLTQTLTVDFVFVTTSKAAGADNYGEINVFEIDSESGRMRQIPASPFPSAGRNPVAEAVSADNNNLFVVNQDDNTVVQFVIGNDGKLYPFATVNTPGIFPLAIAANASNVFVVDTYQPLPICSTADPCSGSIAVYPLAAATKTAPVTLEPAASNSAASTQYWPLALAGSSDIIVPTGVNVLASGSFVYVTAYDSTVTPHVGYVYGFAVGAGGVLTPLPGSPFAAGTQPSAIASDPTSAYLYVTDYGKGQVLAYTVAGSGGLTQMSGSPFQAGNQPSAIAIDQHQQYPFVYVTNSLDATISAYSMSNGTLTNLGTYGTGLQPVAVGIDPSTYHFLYTANYLGNNVTGYELSTTAGTLVSSQFSPYQTNAQPTAVAAIPHNGTGGGVK
jgi:6-phosphogluconolactonase